MTENKYRDVIYEVKYKNFFFFFSFYCLPFILINYFSGENISNIYTILILLVSIATIKSIINEYKFLYKIEFYSDKISLYYYTFFLGNTVQINYACSSIYILYSYPQTINTDYLIIKVAGKRIIKQYRDWGWSTEIFKDIVETFETFKLKANKDV